MADDIVTIQIQPEITEVDTTEVTKSFQESLKGLNSAFSALFDQMGKAGSAALNKSTSSALSRVVSAYKSATKETERFNKKVAEAEASKAGIELLEQELENLQAKYFDFIKSAKYSEEEYRAFLHPNAQFETSGQFGDANKLKQEAEAYFKTINDYEQQMLAAAQAIDLLNEKTTITEQDTFMASSAIINYTSALQELFDTLNNPQMQGASIGENLSASGNKLSASFQRILTILQNIGRVAGRVFSTMRSVINSVLSAVKSLITRLKSLFSKFNKGNKGLEIDTKKLTKTFIQFGLGARSLYFLIRRLRTEFINAMKSMAAQFPEINAQVSQFTMTVKAFKGSFITMLQPIVSAVIPVLSKLLSILTQLNFRLAEFYATLTGQHVIYKATAENVDYADSLGGVADAADKANEKLGEYDNLLVIGQENAGGAGGGGGSGAGDLGYYFEESEVGVSEFAQKLKEAWENADFTGVGEVIAEKLNSIVANVDNWITNTFEPKGLEWSNRIALILNGFFDGLDAENVGETVSDFFNSVVNIVNKFVTTFDWSAAGSKIGQAIASAISNFDTESVGTTIKTFWQGIFNLLYSALSELNWNELGTKFGLYIKAIFSVDESGTGIASTLGSTIGEFLRGILEAGISFLQTNPGSSIGKGIADFLNSLFDKNQNGELGAAAGQMLNNILDLLSTTFSELDWSALGEALFTNVSNFFATVDISAISSAVSSIFTSINDIIWKFFDWFLLPDKTTGKSGIAQTIQFIFDTIAAVIKNTPITEILKAILSIAVKLLASIPPIAIYLVSGIIEAIGTLINQFLPGLGDGMIDMAKSFSGFADEMTKAIVEPISKGFDELIGKSETFKSDTTEVTNDVIADYEVLRDSVVGYTDEIASSVGTNMDTAAEATEDAMQSMDDSTRDHLFEVASHWMETHGSIEEVLKAIDYTIEHTAEDERDSLYTLRQFIIDNNEQIVKNYNETSTNMEASMNTATGAMTAGHTTTAKLLRKNVSAFDKAQQDFGTSSETMKTEAKTNFEAVQKVTTTLKDKLTTAFGYITSSINTLWSNLWASMKATMNSILWGVETMANGIVRGFNKVITSANTLRPLAGYGSGFNVGYLSEISLPRLAQGAVIPPNKEFLAVLGDQSSGTNIEAPLDTIKQAVAEVMSQMSGISMPEKIQIVMPSGKVLAETVWDEERKLYKQTGSYSPRFA